jgi:hypothetical protein
MQIGMQMGRWGAASDKSVSEYGSYMYLSLSVARMKNVEYRLLGKFAFGDRTIPIHARTLGPHLESPNEMGVYYGTELSAVVHTN